MLINPELESFSIDRTLDYNSCKRNGREIIVKKEKFIHFTGIPVTFLAMNGSKFTVKELKERLDDGDLDLSLSTLTEDDIPITQMKVSY